MKNKMAAEAGTQKFKNIYNTRYFFILVYDKVQAAV